MNDDLYFISVVFDKRFQAPQIFSEHVRTFFDSTQSQESKSKIRTRIIHI